MTNSSSSSFVCDICGRTETTWEGLGEVDMVECVNGHIICSDETLELPSKQELIEIIIKNNWNIDEYNYNLIITREELEGMDIDYLFDTFCSEGGHYEVPEFVCPICQFIEYSEYDLSKYLEKEYGVSRDEVFEKIKLLNKRRRKLYDSEYITEVCRKYNLDPIEIVSSWKDKFGTYFNFKKYIMGR